MIGIYAGSFDPFTNGHLEIVDQAADIFDKLVVLVANNPEKKHWFSAPERKEIIEQAAPAQVAVDILGRSDTAVDYACRLGGCLVRGLGEFTDYPAEKSLSGINSRLRPEVKTVFLMTGGTNNQMRSSMVREAVKYRFGWRGIRDTVPRSTLNAVILKLLASKSEGLTQLLAKADLSRYFKRPYHNLEHIIYMVDLAGLWMTDASEAQQALSQDLLAAIVYHDLLVDSDPEVEQGEDVKATLSELDNIELPGCSPEVVKSLIQVTDHRNYAFAAQPQTQNLTVEQRLIIKLDLAVLGESQYEYGRYARSIGEEYGPKCGGYMSEIFREGRRSFLKTLLKRVETGELIDPEFDRRIRTNVMWELDEWI